MEVYEVEVTVRVHVAVPAALPMSNVAELARRVALGEGVAFPARVMSVVDCQRPEALA